MGVWLARAGKPIRQVLAAVGVMVLCTGLMTGVMFGLDKLPIPNEVLYGVLFCTLVALGVLGLRLSKPEVKGGTRSCGLPW